MHIPMVSIIVPTYNRAEDLYKLFHSIKESSYADWELIVVDNASTENIQKVVEDSFPIETWGNKQVKYIRLDINMMAAGGRNAGIRMASGKYLACIDSDNIIDKDMLGHIVTVMEADETIGMAGPIMRYYKDPSRIWFAGTDVNMMTSRTVYWDEELRDKKSFYDTHHIPNLMVIRKACLDAVGCFDESYYIMFEEADMAVRIKNAGWKVVVVSDALTYHNIMLPEEISDNEMRKYGCDNPLRTYHFSKNRNTFIRRYARPFEKIVYFMVFRFAFLLFYCFLALKNNRPDIARAWLKGAFYKERV